MFSPVPHVVHVELNRADKLNAMDVLLWEVPVPVDTYGLKINDKSWAPDRSCLFRECPMLINVLES